MDDLLFFLSADCLYRFLPFVLLLIAFLYNTNYMMDLEDNEGGGGESSEEETASLLAWMSAKKEAMLEEEEEEKEEDDSVPRQLPPKLSPMRKRGEVLTPPSRLLGEETRYSSSEEEDKCRDVAFLTVTPSEDDAVPRCVVFSFPPPEEGETTTRSYNSSNSSLICDDLDCLNASRAATARA